MNLPPHSEDWNPHLYISNLIPEGYLLRLNRLRRRSLAEVAVHLCRFYLGATIAEIVLNLLDVPLARLFHRLEKAFALERTLSARAARIYFERFRDQFQRRSAQLHRSEGMPLPPGVSSKTRVGKTTLRQHLGSDPVTLGRVANALAQDIQRMPFRWDDHQTYELFCRARHDDLYQHLLFWVCEDENAALEITTATLGAFRGKLAQYDPARSSLFTYLKRCADNVLRAYFRDRDREEAKRIFVEDIDQIAGPVEDKSAVFGLALLDGLDDDVVAAIFAEVFDLLFDAPSPPHHLLSFIFHHPLDVEPSDIVIWFSRLPLRLLAEIAEQQFLLAGFPPAQVRANFKKLQERLSRPVERSITDTTETIEYPRLIGSTMGNTRLEDFYQRAGEPIPDAAAKSAKIVQWWNSFVERALTAGVKLPNGPLPDLLRRSARYSRREKKPRKPRKASQKAR